MDSAGQHQSHHRTCSSSITEPTPINCMSTHPSHTSIPHHTLIHPSHQGDEGLALLLECQQSKDGNDDAEYTTRNQAPGNTGVGHTMRCTATMSGHQGWDARHPTRPRARPSGLAQPLQPARHVPQLSRPAETRTGRRDGSGTVRALVARVATGEARVRCAIIEMNNGITGHALAAQRAPRQQSCQSGRCSAAPRSAVE